MNTTKDRITPESNAGASLAAISAASERGCAPRARFDVECREGIPEHMAEYTALITRVNALRERAQFSAIGRIPLVGNLYTAPLLRESDVLFQRAMKLTRIKWQESIHNVVTDVGANDLLDKYLAGSAYTAAWFCGLISSVSFTAVAAANTMSSHAGWTEAGATNAPNYTGNRPAITFAAASGRSKTTSAASSFTFTGAGTIKGMFGTSVTTKDGTTGILYNAVLFGGGDQVVANTNVVNVSVTYTA